MTPFEKLQKQLPSDIVFKKARSDWRCLLWNDYIVLDMGIDGYQLYSPVPCYTMDGDITRLIDHNNEIKEQFNKRYI